MLEDSPGGPWLLVGNSTGDTDSRSSDGTGIVQQNRLLFMPSQYLILAYYQMRRLTEMLRANDWCCKFAVGRRQTCLHVKVLKRKQ